jgi:hypothetical protein
MRPARRARNRRTGHGTGHIYVYGITLDIWNDALLSERKAAAEGRTLTSLLEEGLRIVVSEKRRLAANRALPPISSATGGTLPGVELTKLSVLDELDESERLERMSRFR